MKIKTGTVTNFRSVRSVVLEGASSNVFVGQNNHGQTNLFQAIEWFYSGKGDVLDKEGWNGGAMRSALGKTLDSEFTD